MSPITLSITLQLQCLNIHQLNVIKIIKKKDYKKGLERHQSISKDKKEKKH